jgi:capsular polysaccharide biosynthesis protein
MISCGIAAVFAIVVTMPFITKPKYQATHIFYPSKNNSISEALLSDAGQRLKDPLEFGEEEEAEKAMQILLSGDLIGRLVKNFNLYKHYNINPVSEKYPKTAMDYKLKENISVTRTRYLSVKIEVLDEDPQMAADLANGMALLYDSITTEVQNQIAIPALQIVERALQSKRDKIQGTKDQMRKLGEEGITNYEEQSRALAEEIYKAQSSGKVTEMKKLLEEQKTLVKCGGDFVALQELIKLEEEKESDLISQYERRVVDVNEKLSHKMTIEAASKPEIKFWPKRTFVMIISVLATFMATSLILVFFELYSNKSQS